MGLPEEDRNPYRHAYGDYTHDSANGRYRFEWTPFTPAVKAWENARYYLEQAVKDLGEAKQLPGLGLNGLGDEYAELIGALTVLIEDAQACRGEAVKLVDVLQKANAEYAKSNEASLEQYLALTRAIDGVTGRQRSDHAAADATERATDADRDRTIFPFDGRK